MPQGLRANRGQPDPKARRAWLDPPVSKAPPGNADPPESKGRKAPAAPRASRVFPVRVDQLVLKAPKARVGQRVSTAHKVLPVRTALTVRPAGIPTAMAWVMPPKIQIWITPGLPSIAAAYKAQTGLKVFRGFKARRARQDPLAVALPALTYKMANWSLATPMVRWSI